MTVENGYSVSTSLLSFFSPIIQIVIGRGLCVDNFYEVKKASLKSRTSLYSVTLNAFGSFLLFYRTILKYEYPQTLLINSRQNERRSSSDHVSLGRGCEDKNRLGFSRNLNNLWLKPMLSIVCPTS